MEYEFCVTTNDGTTFYCSIKKHYGNYWSCLEAASHVWEACCGFGTPWQLHPTTGETPQEFRARSKDA